MEPPDMSKFLDIEEKERLKRLSLWLDEQIENEKKKMKEEIKHV
jgi:hypothetical protein